MEVAVMIQVEEGLQLTYRYEGNNIKVSEEDGIVYIEVNNNLEGAFNKDNFVSYHVNKK